MLEALVSSIIQASMTAAGLLIAIFGIIIPIRSQLLRQRRIEQKKKYEKIVKKIKSKTKKVEELRKTVHEFKEFGEPLPYSKEIVIASFLLFIATIILSYWWFIDYSPPLYEGGPALWNKDMLFTGITWSFAFALLAFIGIGFETLKSIFNLFKKEYDEIKTDIKGYAEIVDLNKEEKKLLEKIYKLSHGPAKYVISIYDVFGKEVDENQKKNLEKLILRGLVRKLVPLQEEKLVITELGINTIIIIKPKLAKV